MNKESTGVKTQPAAPQAARPALQGVAAADASDAAVEPRRQSSEIEPGAKRARVRLRDCRQPIRCEPTRRLALLLARRYCSRNTRRERRLTLCALVRRTRHEPMSRQSLRLHGGPWAGRYALLHDASGTLPLCVRVGGVLYRGRYARRFVVGENGVRLCADGLQWEPRMV